MLFYIRVLDEAYTARVNLLDTIFCQKVLSSYKVKNKFATKWWVLLVGISHDLFEWSILSVSLYMLITI